MIFIDDTSAFSEYFSKLVFNMRMLTRLVLVFQITFQTGKEMLVGLCDAAGCRSKNYEAETTDVDC